MEVKNSYVYRHTKLGTSDVFYIGIGCQPKYRRVKEVRGRSKWWSKTANKYGFEAEILAHNLTWKEACELESILIAHYGRKDCCGGILVNATDGGDGVIGRVYTDQERQNRSDRFSGENHPMWGRKGELSPRFGMRFSQEWRENISVALKGKKASPETLQKMRDRMLGKYVGGDSPRARKVINTETLEVFDCLKDGAKSLGIKHTRLCAYLKKDGSPNPTTFEYLDQYEEGSEPIIPDTLHKKTKEVINIDTLEVLPSVIALAKVLNMEAGLVRMRLNPTMRINNDIGWVYLEDYNNKTEPVKVKPLHSKVYNTRTKTIYNSIKDCAACENINYKYLTEMLAGRKKNKTDIQYYIE